MTLDGDSAQVAAERPAEKSASPWDRWGWLMGGVWVFFLISPLHAAWTEDIATIWRIFGVVLVVGFAGVYIAIFIHVFAAPATRSTEVAGQFTYLLLIVMAAGTIPIIQQESMSFLPFIASLGSFVLPVVAAVVALVVATALTVVIPLASGTYADMWFFTLIVALVGLMTLMVRVFNAASDNYQQVKDDLILLAERERVARDVHDVLGHSLTVLTVKSELAQRLVDVDPEEAKRELAQIQSLTREALAEIRATVAGLRVVRLGDELVAAREALRSAGIDADVPTDPEVVDPRHRLLLAWSLREATTNVVRHSGARSCRIELDSDGMRVIDDGRGMAGRDEGNGLRGLRERVEQVGGTASFVPAPSQGTVVEVRL